jgi:hypothetical protein
VRGAAVWQQWGGEPVMRHMASAAAVLAAARHVRVHNRTTAAAPRPLPT